MAVKTSPNIPPFVRFCTASVPMVFDNSMSYYECLCALTKFLQDDVINVINNNAQQLEGLLEGFTELKNYVDNYFDNLDVQEEINAKLDEMAEGGQLAGIIAQFLAAAPVFGYHTIAEMAAATNLANGSIARVIGNTSAAAGDGAYYLIRTRIEADDPDGVNLVAIGDTLVGVRVQDPVANDLAALTTRVNDIDAPKWVFIGDSYSQGYSPDGNTTSWSTLLKQKMGLDNAHCTIADYGGAGFSNPSHPFYQIVADMSADPAVDYVLIAGGANDTTGSLSDVRSGVQQTMANIATKFPNCKRVYVAWIGGRADNYHGNIHLANSYWVKACQEYGAEYLPNLQYPMFYGGNFASDNVHPNQTGQTAIANALYQAVNGTYTFMSFDEVVFSSNADMFSSSSTTLHKYSINNTSYIASYQGVIYLNVGTHDPFSWGHGASIKVGKFSRTTGILGTNYYNNTGYNIGNVIIHDTQQGWYTINCTMYIDEDADVYLRMQDAATYTHSGYDSFSSIDNVQIPMFMINYITDLM